MERVRVAAFGLALLMVVALPAAARDLEIRPVIDANDVITLVLTQADPTPDLTVKSPTGVIAPENGPRVIATGSLAFDLDGGVEALGPPTLQPGPAPFDGSFLPGGTYSPPNWDYFTTDEFVAHAFVVEGLDASWAYWETALFFTTPGLAGVQPRPGLPNDPGLGATEWVSLVWLDQTLRTVYGRAGDPTAYASPFPIFATAVDETAVVLIITPLGTKELPVKPVVSWAADTSSPDSVGFVELPSLTPASAPFDLDIGVVLPESFLLDIARKAMGLQGITAGEGPPSDTAPGGTGSTAEVSDLSTETLATDAAGSPSPTSFFSWTKAGVVGFFLVLGAVLGVRLWGREWVITWGRTLPPPGTIRKGYNRLEDIVNISRHKQGLAEVDGWQLLPFEDGGHLLGDEGVRLVPDDVRFEEDHVGVWAKDGNLRVGSPTDPYAYYDAQGYERPQAYRDTERAKEGEATLAGDPDANEIGGI